MAETPEPVAGDLVAAVEIQGEVFEARGFSLDRDNRHQGVRPATHDDLPVRHGAHRLVDARTARLEAELAIIGC